MSLLTRRTRKCQISLLWRLPGVQPGERWQNSTRLELRWSIISSMSSSLSPRARSAAMRAVHPIWDLSGPAMPIPLRIHQAPQGPQRHRTLIVPPALHLVSSRADDELDWPTIFQAEGQGHKRLAQERRESACSAVDRPRRRLSGVRGTRTLAGLLKTEGKDGLPGT